MIKGDILKNKKTRDESYSFGSLTLSPRGKLNILIFIIGDPISKLKAVKEVLKT